MDQLRARTVDKTQSVQTWLRRGALVVGLLAGCNDEPGGVVGAAGGTAPPPTGSEMNPVGTTAGSTAAGSGAAGSSVGAAGTTGAAGRAAAGSGGTPPASGTAGSSVAGASAAGASGGAAGDAAGAAGSGDAAAGSGGAPSAALPDCMGGAVGPCGSMTTSRGTKIQFGPYGAVMDTNVGKGFEVTIASGDSDGGATCAGFASLFGEDPSATDDLLETGELMFDLFTVYRPANWVEGEKYPIISWGNGTCAQPEGYGPLLRYVASHGYVVVAANSRWVGSNSAMTKALDFMFAANGDMASPYFGKLDTTKVGAMGHSQGGGATVTAARDERIKSVILFNGGGSAVKPFLAISGDMDIGSPTPASMASAVNSASADGAWLYFHKIMGEGGLAGHLTLMIEPERVIEPTVAFFDYTLSADAEAGKFFVGPDCKLCGKPEDFEYGQKGFE